MLACGQGDVGQLGLGVDITERTRLAYVEIPDPVIQVCAGGMHTVCLTNTGQVPFYALSLFGCLFNSVLAWFMIHFIVLDLYICMHQYNCYCTRFIPLDATMKVHLVVIQVLKAQMPNPEKLTSLLLSSW